ncbi:hypothetical protein ACQ4PT_035002 [Festuca glaucescens]
MEEPTNPGGGGHGGGEQGWWSGVSSGGEGQGDGGHGVDAGSGVEDLEELWPSRASNSAAMLAQIWVDNPESSERFSFGLGGLDDSMYCRQGEDMVLIQNNEQIYHLLQYFEGTQVLTLSVKRGRKNKADVSDAVDAKADEGIAGSQSASCIINYADPVVYDLTPPPVYAVDGEGTVFASQSSYFATQESRNDEAHEIPDLNEATNVDLDFDMGVADFNMMEEMRRKEQAEVAERIEEMRQQRMDPLLHCEGDTDIEDLFVTEEVDAVPLDSVPPIIAAEPVAIVEPEKKKKKRKGRTVRSHSSVQIDDILDWKPEAVEDMDAGFVDDMDDDHFEPLTMVPPKGGRKSRAKKRPPRKWVGLMFLV